MMEDSARIDRTVAHAAPRSSGVDGQHLFGGLQARDRSFHNNVVALAERLQPPIYDRRVLDLLPVPVDDQWRRRTDGLQRLGQRRRRSFRFACAANDRRNGALFGSTRPLRILTAAVFAFGTGLVMAGVGSLVVQLSAVPSVTALLN